MKYMFCTIIMICLITGTSFSQDYWWELKQAGSTLGGPIDVANFNSDIVYYGSNSTIYKSVDRGESFSAIGNVPGASEIKCIIVHDSIPGIFIVGIESSPDRIYKTTDDGQSWILSLDSAAFSFFGIPMEQDPSNPETIYTMSIISFMRSEDFGDSWKTISTSTGLTNAPCDIEKFPNSNVLLLGDNTTGIVRSTDGGVTWSQTYTTSGEIPTIAVSHTKPGVAFATKWGGGGGFVTSTDYGETWTNVSGFNGMNMWGVDVQESNGNIVIVGCYSCGKTWRSINGGVTWTEIITPSVNYQVEITDSITQYAAQGAGFYKLQSDYFVPVELISFTAKASNNNVTLLWTTATELNNQGFDVEVSTDNQNFEKIGFVPGFGTTTDAKNYSYLINDFAAGTQYYRLKQIDYDGTFKYTNAVEVEGLAPAEFTLSQNYPNPFNPSTSIKFTLPVASNVSLKLFNLLGEEVAELISAQMAAGLHQVELNADELSSGTYFYVIKATSDNGFGFTDSKKMILLR